MAQIETRQAEKSALFKLLVAQETGDIAIQIAHTEALMEKEDIESVKARFEDWKNSRK